jgi:Cysteine-rich CPCC
MSARYACPCCAFLTLKSPSPGSYELCPVCFWEDDGVQAEAPAYTGGANLESLNQARLSFRELGACSKSALGRVRKPLPDELP